MSVLVTSVPDVFSDLQLQTSVRGCEKSREDRIFKNDIGEQDAVRAHIWTICHRSAVRPRARRRATPSYPISSAAKPVFRTFFAVSNSK